MLLGRELWSILEECTHLKPPFCNLVFWNYSLLTSTLLKKFFGYDRQAHWNVHFIRVVRKLKKRQNEFSKPFRKAWSFWFEKKNDIWNSANVCFNSSQRPSTKSAHKYMIRAYGLFVKRKVKTFPNERF